MKKGYIYLGAVVTISIIAVMLVATLYVFMINNVSDIPVVKQTYLSKEECERVTGKHCGFVMCDVIPKGKTPEDVCGKDFRSGWQPIRENVGVDTSTWQTYRNEQYGFEVKYPESWLQLPYVSGVLLRVMFASQDFKETRETIGGGDILFPIIKSGQRLLFTITPIETDPTNILETRRQHGGQSITVGGGPGVYEEGGNPDRGDVLYTTFAESNKRPRIFQFQLDGLMAERETNRQTLNSILSTFKFIESSRQVSLEECISAASPLEYATKSGIGGDRFSLISEWWKNPKPVAPPLATNMNVSVYDLPEARMGGSDVSFITFFQYGDQYCKFTDNNIKKVFAPLTKDEVLPYFEFRLDLGGSIYSKNKETIITTDAYDTASKTYNKTISTSDRLITTVTLISDGFLIDHIYSSLHVKVGFYREKALVGTDGKITWIERASAPFIYLAPGIMF